MSGSDGFWQRRVVRPIHAQLTQGVAPETIARTFAVGTVCSLFPFLGFTTLLNLGAGLAFRMNHPILQTLNQLLGPVQLVLILVYVRGGELLWGATGERFAVTEMLQTFRDKSFGEFLARFGWAGVHAFTAWLITAPLIMAVVYLTARPLLARRGKKSLA